jgi:hypothetical protein
MQTQFAGVDITKAGAFPQGWAEYYHPDTGAALRVDGFMDYGLKPPLAISPTKVSRGRPTVYTFYHLASR